MGSIHGVTKPTLNNDWNTVHSGGVQMNNLYPCTMGGCMNATF